MEIFIYQTKTELGKKAAADGAEFIRQAIEQRGSANIILATGASQFEMLAALLKENVDWTKVTGFHLDDYIGLPETHPASFRKYLKARFVEKVPIKEFHFIKSEHEPAVECQRVGKIILQNPIDVAFVGIGENGHLAFNDPPADFETEAPYLIVKQDEACRRQQLGEGWFLSLAEDSLRRKGEFIAVTGDGVNDAPAMRSANIGVAMGSGTDVARETSSMIITDDNFSSIVAGVEEGRFAYDNIRKVILLLISTGAAEVILFVLAIFTNLPLPLLAVQILWLNLVTNGIQDVAMAFEGGEPGAMERKPRKTTEKIFNPLMIQQTVVSGLTMGLIVFGL